MVSAVIGSQWGDEGKGKIVDLLAKKADLVVRFHGGNNAGHTVIVNGKRYPFHLIPSGILYPKIKGVIASGVLLDLEVLLTEIKMLRDDNINLDNKLFISERCHLIMPYHKALDEAYENARGKNKLGTTKRGIGPAFADKVSYNGIRVYELMNWADFAKKFIFQTQIKNKILEIFGVAKVDINAELLKFKKYRQIISLFVTDTFRLFQKALKQKKTILFEGAHGLMLDCDWSPYPFSTGSNITTGAINCQAGIPPKEIKEIWGVIKAYTSRVGGGPLSTELLDKTADKIRHNGSEFGTTTGRPRRIGWLDLEAVKFTTTLAGINRLAITKIDILSGLSIIKVCVGYKINNKTISYSSCGYNELAKVKPIYKEFKGWQEDITKVKKYKDLPQNCRRYVEFIEKFLNIPVKFVCNGPQREAVIEKN